MAIHYVACLLALYVACNAQLTTKFRIGHQPPFFVSASVNESQHEVCGDTRLCEIC